MNVYERKAIESRLAEQLLNQYIFIERLKDSGMNENLYNRFKNFKFETPTENHRKVKDKILRWLKEIWVEKPFLVLYGNYGTGKTMIAGKIATILFDKKRPVYFTTKKDFDLKITNFDENVSEFIEDLKQRELVVIDDFLSGYLTDYRFSQLFSILDHRYIERKLTIITANEDLRKHKGNSDFERLKDRLFEVGEFIYFNLPSYRSGKIYQKKEF